MLTISAVCAMTGINPVTLRAWERRYGLIQPKRTDKGHRLYTQSDVERILRALALMRDGVAIGQVKGALANEPLPSIASVAPDRWAGFRRRFAASVAAFDEVGLESIHDEALALYPVDVVDRMLLIPALKELGERWEKVPGGLAEEHFLSTYVRHKIGARFHHRRVLKEGPKLLAACAPGEHHELGLLLFALAAHDAGFRIVLLGANVPFPEVSAATHRAHCDAVVISNAVGRSSPEFYSDLADMAKAAKRPVYVGGNAVPERESQIRAAGAVPLPSSIETAVRVIGSEMGRNSHVRVSARRTKQQTRVSNDG